MNRILILFAHPAYQKSRANRWMVEAVRDLDGVTFHDLYEAYPDFNIDVAHEQRSLLEHEILVLHHPFYWYSAPALVKEWQDLVLEHGFAYGEGGTALQGKMLMTAVTTGGGPDDYCRDGLNCFTIREFLLPFEQTAGLCGMRYLPPFVVHGVHGQDEAAMRNSASRYRDALALLRDDRVDLDALDAHAYMNQAVEAEDTRNA